MIAVLALLGASLNARRKWQGYLCWIISNAWWCWHNINIGEYGQAALFGSFWLLTIYGIYNWKRKGANHGKQKDSIEHSN